MIDAQLTIVLAICVTAGVAFAGLAVYLSTTQGNTTEAIAKAIGDGQCPPLTIELPGGYRLSAGVPVVALYTIAAICGFFLPGMFIYLTRAPLPKPVIVDGSFDRPVKHIAFEDPHYYSFGSNFQISFDPTQGAQDVIVNATPEFGSVTITTEYDRSSGYVTVHANGSSIGRWPVNGDGRVEIPPETRISLLAPDDVRALELERPRSAVSLAGH